MAEWVDKARFQLCRMPTGTAKGIADRHTHLVASVVLRAPTVATLRGLLLLPDARPLAGQFDFLPHQSHHYGMRTPPRVSGAGMHHHHAAAWQPGGFGSNAGPSVRPACDEQYCPPLSPESPGCADDALSSQDRSVCCEGCAASDAWQPARARRELTGFSLGQPQQQYQYMAQEYQGHGGMYDIALAPGGADMHGFQHVQPEPGAGMGYAQQHGHAFSQETAGLVTYAATEAPHHSAKTAPSMRIIILGCHSAWAMALRTAAHAARR